MSNKMSLKWHKNCLKNQGVSIQIYEKELEDAIYNYNKSKSDHEFYILQIETAEKEGRDGFDSERYMVKRNG